MTKTEKAEQPKPPTKIVVTNISNQRGGAGLFLDPGEDYGNRIIGPGRSMTFDCPGGVLPDILHVWGNNVVVHNALDGMEIGAPAGGELSPGMVSPVREMAGALDGDPKRDDFLDEEEPDFADAVDAIMPSQMASERVGPISGDLRQQSGGARAKVSLGSRSDEVVGGQLSPIPGDTPRDLDNSQQYTIKAPRTQHVGSIIGKK